MIKTDKTFLWLVCFVMALGSAGTAWGDDVGHVELGGDGECSNDDCRVDSGGELNPQPMCDPGPCDSTANFSILVTDSGGGDVSDSLNDMADQFELISPGFDPEVTDSTVSFDANRLSTLCVRATGSALSLVGVEHPGQYLYAKIRKITEFTEGGGRIFVWLNRDIPLPPSVVTILTPDIIGGTQADIDALNATLMNAIGAEGYQVVETADYIIVKKDLHIMSGWDLNQVSFESTDPGITIREVSLTSKLDNSSDCDD